MKPRLTLLMAIALLAAAHGQANAAPKRPPAKPEPKQEAPKAEEDDPKAKEDTIDAAVKARFAEGLKLATKKKYEQARTALLQAYGLKKEPKTVLLLAYVAIRLGRALEALRYYDEVMKLVDPPERMMKAIENGRAEARRMLGAISISAPDGAEVTIDDEPAVRTPLPEPIRVTPGSHRVKIVLGDDQKSEKVDVAAGEAAEVKLVAKARATVGPPPPTRPKGPTPVETPPAEAPGLLTPPTTVWPVYLGAAVGIIGMSAAAITGGLKYNADYAISSSDGALNRANTTRARCDEPTAGSDFDASCKAIAKNEALSRDLAPIVTVSVAVGVAGFALAVGYYLFSSKEGPKEAPKEGASTLEMTPWLSPTSGGASVIGSF